MRPFIHHVVCTKSVLNPYVSCSVHEMYHDLSMPVFCFRGHTFLDNFIYELQKSTTIAFSRNSLYTFYPRNPTCGIHQCLQLSNHKYPPCPQNSIIMNPPSPSEILKAVRGMVWIFSGITQSLVSKRKPANQPAFKTCMNLLMNVLSYNFKVPISENFLFSYLNLNITLRTSVKKFFDLHKTRIFYEFYKSLKSYFIAVHPPR